MTSYRPRTGRLVACLAAAALAAGLAASAATAAAAPASAAPCNASQLSGHLRQSSGAAGTIGLSFAFKNISPATCALQGFPRLKLRNAAGPLPTRVRHGGLAILEHPALPVVLAPGKVASLLVTYSDVPTGAATSCPTATTLVVILRGGHGRLLVPATIGACNRGLLRESPFLAGRRNV